jgi:hypothetical protein
MTDDIAAVPRMDAEGPRGPVPPDGTVSSSAAVDEDAGYPWITGLPLGRTQNMTGADAPPPRPARAIAFGA